MRPAAEPLNQADLLLERDRLTLRPLTQEDVTDRYVGWLNDPEVHRWLETRWETQTAAKVAEFLAGVHASGSYLWGMFVPEVGHIGNIKLGPIRQHHECADCSYFIGERSQWGKGYATAAVKLVCEFGFKKLRLHRIQAGCYGGNKASQRVLRKAGFAFEGTSQRALKTPNGWDHHEHYGRISEGILL